MIIVRGVGHDLQKVLADRKVVFSASEHGIYTVTVAVVGYPSSILSVRFEIRRRLSSV